MIPAAAVLPLIALATLPAPRPDAVVAADGSGQYTSVQAAIAAAPTGSRERPWIIQVRPGTYREVIYVQREKRFVALVGEDREHTVVSYGLHANMPGPDGRPLGTFRTATATIDADDFTVSGLTFENTAGPVGQALAVRVDGDRVTFRDCAFLGWQDTVFLNRGRHYFSGATIAGHVDFVFGGATAYFDRCRIVARADGYVTAASTPDSQRHGFVFSRCSIAGEKPGVKTYLGRPWRAFASVAFVDTAMDAAVRPEGWHNWGDAGREKTARFAEYGSTGAGGSPGGRVGWARAITRDEAEALTVRAVVGGADSWDPEGKDDFVRGVRESRSAAPWQADLGDGRYRNPVIFADYSDPDAIRVGQDYYLVASSFQNVPGLPILHSRDLVSWTLVGHAADRLPSPDFDAPQHGNGLWAPSLRYHAGWFWIYVGDPDRGIYMTRAKDPRGPWDPLTLVHAAKGWIDPCPLWDDDGNVYLVHAWAKSRAGFNGKLTLRRLTGDGRALLERPEAGRTIFEGGERHPTVEGPKLYKRSGWYYVFAPAGGVKEGWQTVLRSRAVGGPYEERVVLRRGVSPINGPHQGAWVDTASGESWFLHFQDRGAHGRVVHLQPMRWADDWPVIGEDRDGDGSTEPVLVSSRPRIAAAAFPLAAGLQASDEFDGPGLGLQWQWHGNPRPDWASVSDGQLRLAARPGDRNLWAATHLLLQKLPAPDFVATARMDPKGLRVGERAGLVVMGTDYAALAVERTTAGFRVHRVTALGADRGGAEGEDAAIESVAAPVELRVSVVPGAESRFSVSLDGSRFQTLGSTFTAKPGKWIGARVGLFAAAPPGASATGHADVEWFRVESRELARGAEPAPVRIVLVGDSTVTEEEGWGRGFRAHVAGTATLLNHAKGGRSSKSYVAEGLWAEALRTNPTHVLIQFGHNDQPGKGLARETDLPTYRANIARYIDEARAVGATPIVVTSLVRRRFSAAGRVESNLTEYADAAREVASARAAVVVDLHARSIELADQMGREASEALGPTKDDGTLDRTHLNAAGSALIGALVAAELRKAVPDLAPHILPSPPARGPASPGRWSVRMAESEMRRTPDPMLVDATNGRPRWEYTPGLIMKAILALWQRSGDERFWTYAKGYYDGMIDAEGRIGGGYKREDYNIDRINPGKPLFLLYEKTGDQKYRKAIELLRDQMREHPRTSEGGFWHKKRYPHQMWLDGLYMGAPFLAQYAVTFGEPALMDDVIRQFVLMEKHARDERTGLLYHGWDESRRQRWADPKTGRSPAFWGRAMGWFAMGLVETLDFVPAGHPRRGELVAILRRLAEAVTRYQDQRTGLWWQVVDQGGREGNYLESSVSAMLSFALLKAARLGHIDAKYAEVGRRAYEGLVGEKLKVDEAGVVSLIDICQVAGLGGDPEKGERYRAGTFEYYVSEPVRANDPKGVGPFIFASLELEAAK